MWLLIIALREPNATKLEKEGYGYVVDSIGMLSGEMPYTTFYARKSYIEDNKDVIKGFTKAINKALIFTLENDAEKVAKIIKPQFNDSSLEELTTIVQRYKDADSWLKNAKVEQKLLENLEDVLIDNDLLDKYVPYSDLVISYE